MSTDNVTADGSAVQQIIAAARAGSDHHKIDLTAAERHVYVVPDDFALKIVDPNEDYRDTPRRLKGSVRLDDLDSLTAYVGQYYEPDATTVWVDIDSRQVVAVLDDAPRGTPAWREHRAVLKLKHTAAWTRWIANDAGSNAGRLLDQTSFARHIERCENEIQSPDAAELLEIVSTFESSSKTTFKQSTRLKSGIINIESVRDETAKASSLNGQTVEIPDSFELLLSVFEGEAPVPMTARIRHKVTDGELAMGYELVGPADAITASLDGIAQQLRGSFERTYLGAPVS